MTCVKRPMSGSPFQAPTLGPPWNLKILPMPHCGLQAWHDPAPRPHVPSMLASLLSLNTHLCTCCSLCLAPCLLTFVPSGLRSIWAQMALPPWGLLQALSPSAATPSTTSLPSLCLSFITCRALGAGTEHLLVASTGVGLPEGGPGRSQMPRAHF